MVTATASGSAIEIAPAFAGPISAASLAADLGGLSFRRINPPRLDFGEIPLFVFASTQLKAHFDSVANLVLVQDGAAFFHQLHFDMLGEPVSFIDGDHKFPLGESFVELFGLEDFLNRTL